MSPSSISCAFSLFSRQTPKNDVAKQTPHKFALLVALKLFFLTLVVIVVVVVQLF